MERLKARGAVLLGDDIQVQPQGRRNGFGTRLSGGEIPLELLHSGRRKRRRQFIADRVTVQARGLLEATRYQQPYRPLGQRPEQFGVPMKEGPELDRYLACHEVEEHVTPAKIVLGANRHLVRKVARSEEH